MRVLRLLIALLLIVLVLGLSLCTKPEWSGPLEGQVIDATTRQPIADAIVVVNWQIKGLEGFPGGQLAIFERVTDAQGRFETDRWGPRLGPGGMLSLQQVDPSAPNVWIFKNGYEPLRVLGFGQAHSHPVDGPILPLQRYEGALSDYASQVEMFWSTPGFNLTIRCEWREATRLFTAMVQLHAELQAAGVENSLPRELPVCEPGAR
ncbi:hypothetical protein ACFPN2_03270 [Steroidobacter flavus]|uniref:Carboxypeptidase regulatory-like domain-containing protein n=1 Tax=Steroidobacter flavus TaxID=1842136 RepID=A0ABV8SKQ3_9GAMM